MSELVMHGCSLTELQRHLVGGAIASLGLLVMSAIVAAAAILTRVAPAPLPLLSCSEKWRIRGRHMSAKPMTLCSEGSVV